MSHDNQIVTVTEFGKIIRFFLPDRDDHIQSSIVRNRRFYELRMLRKIKTLLEPGDLVLDVGANIGNHTLYFSGICGSETYAFEPLGICRNILERNIKINQLESLVTVFASGLGSQTGQAKFNDVNSRNLGATSLNCDPRGSIPIVRADDLAIRKGIKLIKIDVEGMELDVIVGASELIQRDLPFLFFESFCDTQFNRIQDLLKELGYEIVQRFNCTPTWFAIPSQSHAVYVATRN